MVKMWGGLTQEVFDWEVMKRWFYWEDPRLRHALRSVRCEIRLTMCCEIVIYVKIGERVS